MLLFPEELLAMRNLFDWERFNGAANTGFRLPFPKEILKLILLAEAEKFCIVIRLEAP